MPQLLQPFFSNQRNVVVFHARRPAPTFPPCRPAAASSLRGARCRIEPQSRGVLAADWVRRWVQGRPRHTDLPAAQGFLPSQTPIAAFGAGGIGPSQPPPLAASRPPAGLSRATTPPPYRQGKTAAGCADGLPHAYLTPQTPGPLPKNITEKILGPLDTGNASPCPLSDSRWAWRAALCGGASPHATIRPRIP
jgi:hypothetical protein